MLLSDEEQVALLGGATGGRDTKRELTRLRVQYAKVCGRIGCSGRDTVVPPF